MKIQNTMFQLYSPSVSPTPQTGTDAAPQKILLLLNLSFLMKKTFDGVPHHPTHIGFYSSSPSQTWENMLLLTQYLPVPLYDKKLKCVFFFLFS